MIEGRGLGFVPEQRDRYRASLFRLTDTGGRLALKGEQAGEKSQVHAGADNTAMASLRRPTLLLKVESVFATS